jgi:hypothetical protein
MPNPIKYSSTTPLNALRKGDVAVGVNNVEYGPTITTGWYNGITPSSGKYVIYKTAATGDPDIFAPQSDQELYNFVIMQGGSAGDIASVGDALAWIATQSDLLATNNSLPNIVTDGLVLNLDAGLVGSYPTTGTTWYDISGGGNNSTLTNGPGFDSNGAIVFDGVDDYVATNQLNGRNPATDPFTIEAWVKSDQTVTSRMWIDATSNGTNQRFYATLINGSTSNIGIQGSEWSDSTPNDTNWHYQAIVMDGNTARGYDNGIQVQTKSYTSYTLPGPLIIGGRSGFYWSGLIANFKIYNRALTTEEITQNYYQAPIVTDGLIYAIDAGNLVSYESGSATIHSLTGSTNGTLVNGVGFDSGNGGSWDLDGTNDYIEVAADGSTSGFNLQSYTIDMWVKLTKSGAYEVLWSYDHTAHTPPYYAQHIRTENSNNTVGLIVNYGGIYGLAGAGVGISGLVFGVWVNLTFTRDFTTGQLKSYKNGVHQNTTTRTGDKTITYYNQEVWIGRAIFATGYMDGQASLYKFYNRALSSTEVTQNYNAVKSRFGL